MEKTVGQKNGTKEYDVIYANEYLNGLSAETLEEKCEDALQHGIKKIIINFKQTELINSIGISIIINIIEKVKEKKARLCFCNLSDIHLDIFKMLGITRYVYMFSSEDEALTRLNSN